MEHTHIVTARDLDDYAERRESEAIIPELINLLVKASVSKISVCRIPYRDAINQPGMDGLLETEEGFAEFVPKGRSCWEIGTGINPQGKATREINKRSKSIPPNEKANADFVFVTPRSSGRGGWSQPRQAKWLLKHEKKGWNKLRIIDGVILAEWLREFPALGKWMAKEIGISRCLGGISTPAEHWQLIQGSQQTTEPPLPAKIFIDGRENACTALQQLFEGKSQRLFLFIESEGDIDDFVAGYLETLESETRKHYSNRCLFISDEDSWRSVVGLRKEHVLVASPRLGLDSTRMDLQTLARKNNHAVVIPICGAGPNENHEITRLNSPSRARLKILLVEGGFSETRSQELASVGDSRLSALRRHLLGLSVPPYATWENARLFALAGLIGKWDGNNSSDRESLEILIGKKGYGEWIEAVRHEALRPDAPLIQHDERWRIVARGEAWNALGSHLADVDLDNFAIMAVSVLGEHDPKLDLPKHERFMARINGHHLKHSEQLREGIAETLALLGSRAEALPSCSHGKVHAIVFQTVHGLLNDADWKTWAGLESLLPLLAEADPDAFLDAVELLLNNPPASPFNEIFAQEGTGGVGEWNYLSGLLWALECLAWHPDYLSRVVLILGDLASIDPGGTWANRPANTLVDIFLPWHLQTCVSFQKRMSAIDNLISEHPEVGWKLLMALLPHSHGFTAGCYRPVWRNLIDKNWDFSITYGEYWQQIEFLFGKAFRVAKTSIEKLIALIDELPDIPYSSIEELLSFLATDGITALPENQRLPLWEALCTLARKHRNYASAEWALPPDLVSRIEVVCKSLAPDDPQLIYQQLFSEGFYLLYESGDYAEKRKNLDLRREKAIKQLYEADGIDGIIRFASRVAAPRLVGIAFGSIATESSDDELLPEFLQTKEEFKVALVRGFVLSRFFKHGWNWVDQLLSREWTTPDKATFLCLLPFQSETWERAEAQLGAEENLFWRSAWANTWGVRRDIPLAAEKLIRFGRPNAAVQCLWSVIEDKEQFNSELALKALLEVPKIEIPEQDFDQHATIEVISKLQELPGIDTEALSRIEWYYLPLLDRFSRGYPKTLGLHLAADPSFFCDVIRLIFRSKKPEKQAEELTEEKKKLAHQAYRLLDEWKTPPGTQWDGSFDPQLLKKWIQEAKTLSTESGHYDIALSHIGRVLFYTPKDTSGLWIHRVVACELNAKDAKSMRSGFASEKYNKRGTFTYTAGKDERKLAHLNREQAEALESEGFTRFATEIRRLADSYERDAEREEKNNPFEE